MTTRLDAPRYAAGFTLLEVLLAVAIFVVVGALAMGGYNELVKQNEIVQANMVRTRAVQTTIQRMAQDFALLEPRPVREPLGATYEPALRADSHNERLADLTRAGWSNPAGVPRPTLQRVAYRLQNNQLRREYWSMLDRTLTSEPSSAVLLDRVRSVSLRFMDNNRGWQEQWPPLGAAATAQADQSRPIAVEITLELEDWGRITRLIVVSG
jgi:general secretion pathway protein J